ncbi:MAG: UvrD-helicase domain-containing protein [Patescibacteria group bacterium]|nr:UvrD-helicase domain-containing protein [Patescibacteria group bacterium]
MDTKKELNQEQRQAITFEQGPLLIIAGAGTGKTAVITERIAYLIKNNKAKAEEILALTFTDKAAGEMEERVDGLLDYGYMDLWISTFHSFCERILKEYGLDIGLSTDFKLLDQTSTWLFVKQNLDKFQFNYYKPLGMQTKFISALISHFSRCKDQNISPEDYLEYSDKLKTNLTDLPESQETERIKEVANAYHIYQKLLLENNFLDFGDLINYTLQLFQKRPLILKKYREKFKYILIDEFQDTNWAQYELAKILAAPKNNLTVCSDDDQCLPPNALISTDKGRKRIDQIKVNDLVVTAVGKGHLSYAKVRRTFSKRKKTNLLTFKTKKGYTLQVTDNHKMFCFTPRVSNKKYHYIYLMKRDNLGWRLGTTNDLATRLRLERSADRILAIKSCKKEEEVRFYETLYSLKYGIPTNCFKERDGVMIKGDWVTKLYKEIDVEKGVMRLAKDLNIDLNAHHYSLGAVTRGSSKRIKINLNICKRNYRSKHAKSNFLINPLVYHQVTLETSNKKTIRKLKLSGFKLNKTKKGYKLQIKDKDIKKIGKVARDLQRLTGGILECGFVVGKTNIVSQKALVIPARNILPGLCLPVVIGKEVIYDEVKEVVKKNKNLVVYDLEIEQTHNFVANGIVVHNSVYKFRGASFNNIIQFKKDFPKAKEISLIKNYRSAQNILDLSYKFIQANNPNRLEYISKVDKKLIASKKEQGIIEYLHFKDSDEEAQEVINKIAEILEKDTESNFSDFAILIRANQTANSFIGALIRAGFPYQFLASEGLYSKPIILDIISYFKILDNNEESSSVYRILNMPFLEIASDDIMKITQYCSRKTKTIYQGLKELPLIQGISEKARNRISFVLSFIEKHTKIARDKRLSEILISFLKDSEYLSYLIKKDAKQEFDLINQFYKKVKEFEETTTYPTIKNFIEQMNSEIESGERGKLKFDVEQGPDMVKIMTVHSAKGLEFKYVFLVNLVDKRFPTIQRKEPIEIPLELAKEVVPKGDVHLEEERRLFYVAMTRAKEKLFFTLADDYGGIRNKKPSRFLYEMGFSKKEDFIENKTEKENKEQGIFKNLTHKTDLVKNRTKQGIALPSHFSFSQLAAFGKCPLQYKFAYIYKVPTKGKAVFSFGKTIHNTLYEFLKIINEKKAVNQNNLFGKKENKQTNEDSKTESLNILNFEDLIEIYKKEWIDEWYESQTQKQEYYKLGKKILKDFYEKFLKDKPNILKVDGKIALELPFKLKIGKYVIFGIIDRVDKLKDGIRIIDYKTGAFKEKLLPKDKQQLLIYQIALEDVFGLKPTELGYYYLEEGKVVSFLGKDIDKEKQKEKILSDIEKIKQSDFKANPGWHCKFCDFKDICDFAK